MRRQLIIFAILAIPGSAAAFAQAPPASGPPDGIELLRRVTTQYADARVYDITAVEERTSTSENSRSWEKSTFTAREMAGSRFYFEGNSGAGHALKLSDGKTVWLYRVTEHRYTAKAQPIETSSPPAMTAMTETAMMQAEKLKKSLATLATPFKSADRLPEVTLASNGHEISCEVVRVRNADQKRLSPDYVFDKTIWIDKTHETVVRMVEHAHTHMLSGASRIPIDQEITTTFTTAELNGPAREDLFLFIPPPDAKLIQNFPDPAKDFGDVSLAGNQVPSLKLKSADGTIVSLDSFRGKPVLIDFWATWCGPCVAALPQLAHIYQEAKDKGLVLLAIDQDEEGHTAADLLSRRGYTWRNFHDGDGEIEKRVGANGIPRTMLIDAQGKITYDATGMNEDDLRTQIAKLGPEYASLTPKPKQTPCIAVSKP